MWVTKQSRAILENVIVSYVIRKVLKFYGTRRFTVVYTRALHWFIYPDTDGSNSKLPSGFLSRLIQGDTKKRKLLKTPTKIEEIQEKKLLTEIEQLQRAF